jgi:DNA polymerase elongation subunit (family B)
MADFYTSVLAVGNNILYRGVKNGRSVCLKVAYTPTLFLQSNKQTKFKSLNGETLEPLKFETMKDARDFIKNYEQVENFKVYGNSRFEYAFIAETFKGDIEWDQDKVKIAVIDIEVGSENGFPDPYIASEPITAICIKYMGGETKVYGCGDYNNTDENVKYIKCRDEYTLCKTFLEDWQANCPDVVTGWNIKFFDIPYLVNRFRKILGEDSDRKLSPWYMINEREVYAMNKKNIAYEINGVATLDYIELYRWYAPGGKSQESYRLDNIAQVELGEGKISYDEFENLHQLYRLNYQKFIEYNIKDVDLIFKLEDKLKLIELGLTIAYDTKTNYSDIFAQTRMWDAMTYGYLLNRDIIVPPNLHTSKDGRFEGAYVKDPQVGMHEWVASFDLNSLYPHLMMQYNISPETVIDPKNYTLKMRDVISNGVTVDKMLNKEIDLDGIEGATLTPNGQFFNTKIRGFLPNMLQDMYEDRKKFKNMMLKAQQDYENEKDESKKYEIEKRIARYNNLQLAKKVGLNSAYGALGSQYFRFYDLRMALGVTSAGQLSIRWIENKLNQYMNKLLKTDKDYVIASDTDSIYLRLSELVKKVHPETSDIKNVIAFMDRVCEDKIQPFIDESYKELADYVHAFEQKMQMKREALANKGIWTAKKRYIMNVYNNEGVQYNEPHMKVMGLEMVKSSTPQSIRGKMSDTIKLMINGTESDVQDFIAQFRKDFKSLPPEEISFPRGMNGLKDYSDKTTMYKKGTPIHVKGAIIYNHNLEKLGLTKKYPLIQEGEKIKFTYLKQPNPFKDTVISYPSRLPSEFKLENYIDYDTQFEKAYLEPVKIILNCLNWEAEKTNSLDSFFL